MKKVSQMYGKAQSLVSDRTRDGYISGNLVVKCPICQKDLSPSTFAVQSHLRLGHKDISSEKRRELTGVVFPNLKKEVDTANSREVNK